MSKLKRRKKVLSMIGAAAIAAGVMFNVSLSSRGESFSYLALANIEALAICESGCGNYNYCCSYDCITYYNEWTGTWCGCWIYPDENEFCCYGK